jgi:hypothetical protein
MKTIVTFQTDNGNVWVSVRGWRARLIYWLTKYDRPTFNGI